MFLFPNGVLGRILVGVLILATISYLVLNLVSFGGIAWINYNNASPSVKLGLWRACTLSDPNVCHYWTDNVYSFNVTNDTSYTSKPSFVRSAQGLEIVSLIFYIVAFGLIIIGLLNIDAFPYKISFAAAAALLFLCIIFISASLGVMSVQGRKNILGATLGWAWGVGLAGLILTIICFFTLISLILYMTFSSSEQPQNQKNIQRNLSANFYPQNIYPSSMNANAILPPPFPINPTNNYPQNIYPFSMNTNAILPPPFPMNPANNYPQNIYPFSMNANAILPPPIPMNPANNYPSYNSVFQPYYSNETFQNPNIYAGQNPVIYGNPYSYSYLESPSPLVSELFRQYLNQISDAEYERQLLQSYGYFQDPYTMTYNNYL